MIYDCTMYLDDQELLELRMETLKDVVDGFVVVEGEETFSGKPRAPLFGNALHLEKQKPLETCVMPRVKTDDPWVRERLQRDYLVYSRTWIDAELQDLFLIGDIDEIPRPEVVLEMAHLLPCGRWAAFEQDWFYFWLNARDLSEKLLGTRMVRKVDIGHPHETRSFRPRSHEVIARNGGWNFAWLGDVDRLVKKIESFSHQELNQPDFKDRVFLEYCRERGVTAHNSHELEIVAIDETFPKPLLEHPERWQRHFHPSTIVTSSAATGGRATKPSSSS
ncbi:MAG: hypothetical protein L0170_05105 [Acidobacteria bacterium]|nr:hypothetical protein [Acidobacteriota bacterium]